MPSIDFHGEEGFSLVELMVTIAIVGIAFAALLGGLMTSVIVSSHQREQATADAVARSAAEWVKVPTGQNAYSPCATKSTYSLSGLSVPSGYAVTITDVQNWDPAPALVPASYSPHFSTSQPGCSDHGLQLITIRVQSSDSQATESVQVIKRDTRAAP